MRKTTFIILVIVCIIIMINNIGDDNKEIRVRIIPNSNGEKDLYEKQIVKNVVICYLKEAYDENYNYYIDNINSKLQYLENVIAENIDQNVIINFGNHTLYNKTYNSSVVKNTIELTLLVTIGKGQGDNWWGTVYPDFLLVNGQEVMKYESLFIKLFNKTSEDYND